MKKTIIIMTFLVLTGIISSGCSSPVPQNEFRIQTRKKFHLFGIPLPFSTKLPFVSINLKTNTMPGSPNTTGTRTEYNPGGQFVNTGLNANFDTFGGAVLPAPWIVKAAPNQALCDSSSPTTYNAIAGKKYNFRCRANITIDFLVQPSLVNLAEPGSTPPDYLLSEVHKDISLLSASQNLTVQYYKQQGSSEDYELIDEKPVSSIINGGRSFTFEMPDTNQTNGYAHYRVLVVDNVDNKEIYVAHGEFEVIYPLIIDFPDPKNQ